MLKLQKRRKLYKVLKANDKLHHESLSASKQINKKINKQIQVNKNCATDFKFIWSSLMRSDFMTNWEQERE